ncbi:MAG: PD40 domain-containing protein [Deltaproteobacteria bacterium]|nr:PD40 domain-containing protein [Deltaproteobacteria bacterium]
MSKLFGWMSLSALLLLPVPGAVAGQTATPLSPDREGNALNPRWSPDGAQVAYEVTFPREKVTSLFMVEARTGREEEVLPPSGSSGLGGRFLERKQVNHEFSWASRGGLYAFASSGADDEFDLYIKGVTTPIGSEEKEGGAVFSSDSRYLAFSSARTGEGDLYLIDIFELEAPPRRLTADPGLEFYADFAPNRSALAYSSLNEDGANIHVIDDVSAASPTARALTAWKATQLKPSWSPDGRRIAFYSNHHKEDRTHFDLYVAAASGDGIPQKLLEDVIPNERRGPAWTPDSRSIVTVKDDPNAGDPLMIVDVASKLSRALQTGTVNNSEPNVGKDGEGRVTVAFVSQGMRGSEAQAWRRVWLFTLPPS